MKVESFLGLVLVNHLLQQLIQIILVLQHGLPQNEEIFYIKRSDFRFITWFMSILKFGLPRLWFKIFHTKTELFFEPFQSRPKGI